MRRNLSGALPGSSAASLSGLDEPIHVGKNGLRGEALPAVELGQRHGVLKHLAALRLEILAPESGVRGCFVAESRLRLPATDHPYRPIPARTKRARALPTQA